MKRWQKTLANVDKKRYLLFTRFEVLTLSKW